MDSLNEDQNMSTQQDSKIGDSQQSNQGSHNQQSSTGSHTNDPNASLNPDPKHITFTRGGASGERSYSSVVQGRGKGGRGGRGRGRGNRPNKRDTPTLGSATGKAFTLQPLTSNKAPGSSTSPASPSAPPSEATTTSRQLSPTQGIDTAQILQKMEDLSSTSLNHTSLLSSKIETLIDVLTKVNQKPAAPSPILSQPSFSTDSWNKEVEFSDGISGATSTNDEGVHGGMVSHNEALMAFFSGYPFHLDPNYIQDFLLDRFETVRHVFTLTTLRIRPTSLIVQLNRLGRLDDYEELEDNLVVFYGLIRYLKSTPEEDVDLRNFDPDEYYFFVEDQWLDIREELVGQVTRLRQITEHNTRASTLKYRARTGTDTTQPKHVDFDISVQGGVNQSPSTSGTPSSTTFRGHNVNTSASKSFPGAYTPAPAPATTSTMGKSGHNGSSAANPGTIPTYSGGQSTYHSANTPGVGTQGPHGPHVFGTGSHYPHSPGAFSATGTAYSTAQAKIVKRGVFEHKPPKWNGTYEGFPAAEAQLRSYTLGSKMPFVITIVFLNCYTVCKASLKKIHETFRNHDNHTLYEMGSTFQQLKLDCEDMFGAVVSIGQGKYATAVTNKYDKNSDGFVAYIDLIEKYRLLHSVQSQQATVIIKNPLYPSYHGGLAHYLLDLEEAYVKLDKIAEEKGLQENELLEYIPDSHELEQLRIWLLPFEAFHPMLSAVETRVLNSQQVIRHFRNEGMTIAHDASLNTAKSKSGRQINLTDHIETDETEAVSDSEGCELEDYRLLLLNRTLPEKWGLEDHTFRCIPREARCKFINNRTKSIQAEEVKLKKDASASRSDTAPNSKSSTPGSFAMAIW